MVQCKYKTSDVFVTTEKLSLNNYELIIQCCIFKNLKKFVKIFVSTNFNTNPKHVLAYSEPPLNVTNKMDMGFKASSTSTATSWNLSFMWDDSMTIQRKLWNRKIPLEQKQDYVKGLASKLVYKISVSFIPFIREINWDCVNVEGSTVVRYRNLTSNSFIFNLI